MVSHSRLRMRQQLWKPLAIGASVIAIGATIGMITSAGNGPVSAPAGSGSNSQPDAVVLPVGAPQPISASATSYCSGDQTARQVIDLVRDALLLHQTFNVPKSGDLSVALSNSEANSLIATADSELGHYYGESLAAEFANQYEQAIRSETATPKFRALGGGVSTFSCSSVSSAGAGAIAVNAQATTWATIEMTGDNGAAEYAQPTNLMNVSAVVLDPSAGSTDAGRIVGWNIEFANGSGP